jgi:acyl carrier protein
MHAEISDIVRSVANLPDSQEIDDRQRLHFDLGINSVKLVEMIVMIEAKLGVDLGDEFSKRLVTVGDLRSYVAMCAGE